MNIWMMMLPCIGLALDDFILMMGKGATLKDLTTEKTTAYAGIFGFVNLCAALFGYLIALLFGGLLVVKVNAMICALIFLALGMWFVHKALTRKGIVERLDLSFNWKQCVKMAIITNITTIFYGMANGMMGSSLILLLLCAYLTCFVAVFVALRIGYAYGYRYGRGIQGVGGALLLIMALSVWFKFLR